MYEYLQRLKRLSTHEDAKYFHIHKVVGVWVLAHFAYRLYLFATVGSMMFDRSLTTAGCIAGHAFLHVTAFEFILPKRRNMVYNIIFPEMRWHTLIFAYRAMICMLITIYFPHFKMLNGVVVIGTMISADAVTRYFKPVSTTMRGNPYPKGTPEILIKSYHVFYAVSQFLATLNMVYYGADAMFVTLIPIQTVPLLMTLAKKGIISKFGWHALYTFTLLIGYYRALMDYTSPNLPPFQFVSAMTAFVALGRLRFNINKYVLWSIAIAPSI